jgi:hypothetical protein
MSTIVTAYYQIPSKASHETYLGWALNFLKNIENNIVFFTTEDLIDNFKTIRTQNIIYEVLPFSELEAVKKYGYDFWQKHKNIDPETYHTPELGMIWYEKKEFVLRAIEKNYFNTDVFIWCDAGCMRSNSLFPKINTFGKNLSIINKDKLNIQIIAPVQNKAFYKHPDICMAGAIIVGNHKSWLDYKNRYDEMLVCYNNENVCAISDQYVTISIFNKYPDLFNIIYPQKQYIDVWFFLLEELSN